MLKPDERVLKAFVNLEGNPDFQIINDWWEKSYAEMDKLNILDAKSPDAQFRHNQGRLASLYELLTVKNTAKQKLIIINESKKA